MKRLVTVKTGLVTIVMLFGIAVDYSRANIPEIPGKIAYIRDGNVWIAKANGDDPQRLTTTGDCGEPHWSPDGTKIAYIRGGNIWIIKKDGSNPQQLTTTGDCGVNYSWSSDSIKIAYIRGGVNPYAPGYLWCYDLTTRRATRILPDPEYNRPQWSPDGNLIAFEVSLTGPKIGAGVEICSPSGQNRKTLTKQEVCSNAGNFIWSPNGKRIYHDIADIDDSVLGIAFVELSNPGRSHTIYKTEVGENGGWTTDWQFLNEKTLAFVEAEYRGDIAPEIERIVTLNVDTREFSKGGVLRPASPNCYARSVCFLGDAKKFWLEEVELGEGKPWLITLIVNGKIVKTIEGTDLDWVYGK